MIRRIFLLLTVVCVIPISAQADLTDAWQDVQDGLAEGHTTGVEEETLSGLREEASELSLWRMPSFAAAFVTWAFAHPGDHGELAINAAKELDPEYPSSYFLQSRWSWNRRAWLGATGQYLGGLRALFEYEPTRRVTFAWISLWILISVAVSFLALIAAIIIRYLRQVVYDAYEIGTRAFRSTNAWVFAVVVVLLPLFAGLGPIWLFVYLFALTWVYLDKPLRIWAVIACVVLALTPVAVDGIQRIMLRNASLVARVGTILDERQMDFATLREFSDLEEDFEEIKEYHLILGELLRMHGETGQARVQFQKASLADRNSAQSDLFLGNLAMEDGDVRRAIQFYNSAIGIDDQNALAYHNLSLAFDLNRRFQEGDAARAKAREIAGRKEAMLGLRGRDQRIRYPRLGIADVRDLMSRSTPDLKLAAGEQRASFGFLVEFFNPISMVFLFGGAFGSILLTVRSRRFGPSRECTKCGKIYRLEQGFGESSVYCSQCVSVFLKRDVVSIEQQTVKLEQIQSWERWSDLIRRIAGVLAPGSLYLLGEKTTSGMAIGLVAWICLVGGLFMVPLFLSQVEPMASAKPVQVLLFGLFALVWARSVMHAWFRR